MGRAVGIDLGTTNSVVSALEGRYRQLGGVPDHPVRRGLH